MFDIYVRGGSHAKKTDRFFHFSWMRPHFIRECTNLDRGKKTNMELLFVFESTVAADSRTSSILSGQIVWRVTAAKKFDTSAARMGAAPGLPLRDLPGTRNMTGFPSMVVDSNDHIHIVWQQGTLFEGANPSEVYYIKSINGGGTWSPPKRLTWNAGYSKFPRLAVDSNDHLHLAWRTKLLEVMNCSIKKARMGELPGAP